MFVRPIASQYMFFLLLCFFVSLCKCSALWSHPLATQWPKVGMRRRVKEERGERSELALPNDGKEAEKGEQWEERTTNDDGAITLSSREEYTPYHEHTPQSINPLSLRCSALAKRKRVWPMARNKDTERSVHRIAESVSLSLSLSTLNAWIGRTDLS